MDAHFDIRILFVCKRARGDVEVDEFTLYEKAIGPEVEERVLKAIREHREGFLCSCDDPAAHTIDLYGTQASTGDSIGVTARDEDEARKFFQDAFFQP